MKESIENYCPNCGKQIPYGEDFCSMRCDEQYYNDDTDIEIDDTKIIFSSNHFVKKSVCKRCKGKDTFIFFEGKGNVCQQCGFLQTVS